MMKSESATAAVYGSDDLRRSFDFWRVVGVSSLAVAIINLGLLYFLTLSVQTLSSPDYTVYTSHGAASLAKEEATRSAVPAKTTVPSPGRR